MKSFIVTIKNNKYSEHPTILVQNIKKKGKKILEMNYEELRKCLTTDPRIHENGTFVPGHDGQFGFGGKCFPKDTQYLLDLLDNSVLQGILNTNNKIREKK